MILLDGEVVLDKLCISGPERDFFIMIIFKVYLFIIGLDESEKLC